MGVVEGIGINQFPKQHKWCGQRANVCFNYDTLNTIEGTIIRMDAEGPMQCIIMLDDGRAVLPSECQFSPMLFADRSPIPPSMWQKIGADSSSESA